MEPQQIPEWLRNSPPVLEARRLHEQATLAERETAVARLQAAEAAREQEAQSFKEADADAAKNIEAARRALQDAQAARGRIFGRHQNETSRLQGAVRREQEILLEGADPAIGSFIDELQDLLQATREAATSTPHFQRSIGGKDIVTRVTSNQKSVDRRIAAITDTIAVAEALKLAAVPDVPMRLEALRGSLPELESETFSVRPGVSLL
jgi:hypothetical protein